VLKPGRWLSLVFCHRDLSYWYTIRDSAEQAGFRHVNTVVQPLDVVWSMHRKKNPLKVLAGELVINFLKPRASLRRRRERPRGSEGELRRTIKVAAESVICAKGGATTEEIYFVLIPKLLESSLATEATANGLDLVSVLPGQGFTFSEQAGRWQFAADHEFAPELPAAARIRAYVRQCLEEAKAEGRPMDSRSVFAHVVARFGPTERISLESVLRELREIGRPIDEGAWELRESSRQLALF